MAGWIGHAGPNPMQRADCWACAGVGVNGGQCGTCGRRSHEPYIVVFDVGQGNLNAIVDAEGKVLAYFDFGYSISGDSQPVPPTRPCFCDDPIIILSHWDKDHINLNEFVPQCLTAEWLVPEQAHSDFATKLQKKIKASGGRLTTVPYVNNARHITFPWGFVERCSGPRTDVNGSGMVAFVCVRHSPGHPATQVAAPSAEVVTASAISPAAQRAGQAYAAVAGRIGALGVLDPHGNVLRAARPLAAMLAASQTITGFHPRMPVAECVDAAIHAADGAVTHGHNAVTIATNLGVGGALPTLQAHNHLSAGAVRSELGRAAVAVAAQRSYPARVRAAAGQLNHDGSIPNESWTQIGLRAASPLPALGGLGPLRTGAAAIHRDERYILLNGDAEYRFIRPMQQNPRPRVVGMTAMHHGAAFEGKLALEGSSIPFAPGSLAAKAVVRFRQGRAAAGSVVSVVTEAGLALQRRRKRRSRRPLRVAASRTARAAAAAIYAVQAFYPGQIAVAPNKFAAVAAAAAVAAWRYPDSVVVGVAAFLASTTETASSRTDTSPIETVIDVAHASVTARRGAGPGLTPAQVKNVSGGGLDGDLLDFIDNIASACVAGGHVGLNANDVGQEAASALGELWGTYKNGVSSSKAAKFKRRIKLDNNHEDIINDVATAATAAIMATAHGQANRHLLATACQAAYNAVNPGGVPLPPAIDASVRQTVQADYWAAPMLLIDAAALRAARLAAERAVAFIVGTTCEAVRAVIASAHDPRLKHDALAALGPRARRDAYEGRIVYSYGIDANTFTHGYASQSVKAGYCGHAHPLAVRKYEARGWTRRLNASARSRHRGAQGDPDRGHPYGHAWLAWDSVNDAPHPPSRETFRCRRCGKSYAVNG